MSAPLAYISLGSNLGDSREILLAAMTRLQSFSEAPIVRSSLWQTDPVDCPPGSPPFVNAVLGLEARAGELPETLLQKLRGWEREFGRQPKLVLNEPRPLDLDLICWGAETRQTTELILPHPRAHLRRFVLEPLAEIAPELVFPGRVQTVAQLLAGLPAGQTIVKL